MVAVQTNHSGSPGGFVVLKVLAAPDTAERERRVMRLRYGFDGDDALVLAQIGEQLNISRERVRQIEQHALKKLRNEAKKGRLREIV